MYPSDESLPQLIKKTNPATANKSKVVKKKRRKGVADELRRKAGGSEVSSSESDSDDMQTSEAESLLAEDPTYRLPKKHQPESRYTPFIETIFGGKLASVIVCEECRGVNRIEEDFLDISLPIKGDDGKVKRVRYFTCRENVE
jgi:hypothetical protein